MPTANLKEAISTGVKARTINNGQSCIAAKRFIVASAIYDEFERGFVDEMKSLVVGDPIEDKTEIGPLATPQIVKDLDEQVHKAVASGARVLTGGKRIDRPGNFYEPTVLVDVDPSTPVSCEEIRHFSIIERLAFASLRFASYISFIYVRAQHRHHCFSRQAAGLRFSFLRDLRRSRQRLGLWSTRRRAFQQHQAFVVALARL
jgi:hypothetical protein